ncbi:zinc-binding metallopeptidase family protein [Acuticoccus sp.]|uniref:zinc-binding metallopeptidase family protein n=1 Tax=Acuticoccus sp. TaxID=1904378 RepID=UPI003B51EA96
MKRFACRNCGNEIYFESTTCVRCGNTLGYAPQREAFLSTPLGGTWTADGEHYALCANAEHLACNWLVPQAAADALCVACGHNRTIPDLSDADAIERWRCLEFAKRTLFYSLMRWRLPHPTKAEDEEKGLAFDLLADTTAEDGTINNVMTGHANGLITIAIAEGDDAERERRRTQMGEPYRTLIGHFRHEVGHYYWERLVSDAGRLDACRALFGDDREDYAEALQRHYREGPPPDWQDRFITSYASSHPWEDWAETFAHYLHMVDALETAASYGLRTRALGDVDTVVDLDPYTEGSVRDLLAAWVPVTVSLNAINRSMGQPDLYPFVVSVPVEEKLGFVHDLLRAEAASSGAAARELGRAAVANARASAR